MRSDVLELEYTKKTLRDAFALKQYAMRFAGPCAAGIESPRAHGCLQLRKSCQKIAHWPPAHSKALMNMNLAIPAQNM